MRENALCNILVLMILFVKKNYYKTLFLGDVQGDILLDLRLAKENYSVLVNCKNSEIFK